MCLSVIPLVVWLLVALFSGGAIGVGGTVLYLKWSDHKIVPTVDVDGVVRIFPDPMNCVDYYYKAVLDVNHAQYQFCVYDPNKIETFEKKAKELVAEMGKKGLKRVSAPVKGRTDYKEINGTKGAEVVSISPWSGKEERYIVVSQGQSWKIVKEK